MSQYVCVRLVKNDDSDIALFDRDWNNTLYFFIMNADEQIYMRYGGRDQVSDDTYLNLSSLELALRQGLELHQKYLKGELKKTERPKPSHPRDYPLLVERTIGRGACVECHLIGDYINLHKERDGTLDKMKDLYRSPDIKTIGINLDIPKGLVVKSALGAVQEAGMRPGDRIAALNGTPVWTFGDLQYYYDKVDRRAKQVQITVEREGKPIDLTVALPKLWWLTDVGWRQSSVDPRVYFESRPLTEAEKRDLGLKADGFAGQVKSVDSLAKMLGTHQLQVGDIIYGVDGVEQDEVANTPELFIKLRKTAGQTVTLSVIRDGRRQQMQLNTLRMNFRK